MNKLTLKLILLNNKYSRSHYIDILIDGITLISIIKDIELPMARAEGHPKLAGGYGCAGVYWHKEIFYGRRTV
jgi:hypothetical protein